MIVRWSINNDDTDQTHDHRYISCSSINTEIYAVYLSLVLLHMIQNTIIDL